MSQRNRLFLKKIRKFGVKKRITLSLKRRRKSGIEYLRFNRRKPEFNRTFRITIGVMAVNFHLSDFLMGNGMAGPFASCEANVIYGGTYGNSDGVNGHPSGG